MNLEKTKLPDGWRWGEVKDVLQIVKGNRFAGDSKEDGLYPLYTCKEVIPKSDYADYEGEHILLGTGGVFRIYRETGKFSATGHMLVAKAKENVSAVYVFHYLKTLLGYFNSKGTGSTIKNLKKSVFETTPIPIPPYETQLEIAEKLLAVESVVHDIDSNLKEFDVIRQEILTRAFRGDLTEQNFDEGTGMELLKSIQLERQTQQTKGKKKTELAPVSKEEEPYELPPNWTWTRLGEVGTWGAGGTPSRSESSFYENGTFPWVKTGDLNDGVLETVDEFITEHAVNSLKMKIRKPGDVLIAMYGATIGKLAMLNIEATTNQACCACTTFKDFNNKFLYFYLKNERENFRSSSFGGAQPNISKGFLENYPIPLPPLAEQHRIVAKIEAIFSALDVMEDAITKQKDEAKACYEEILRKEMGTVEAKTAETSEKELENTSEEMV